jgi:hypothetical protein
MYFSEKYKRTKFYVLGIFLALTSGGLIYIYTRYHVEREMTITVKVPIPTMLITDSEPC